MLMWRLLVTSIHVPIDEYYLQKEKKTLLQSQKEKVCNFCSCAIVISAYFFLCDFFSCCIS